MTGDELVELGPPFVDVNYGTDSISCGDKTYEHWRKSHDDDRNPSVIGGWVTTNVFEYIEAVSLRNIFCIGFHESGYVDEHKKRTQNHNENGKPYRNTEIHCKGPQFVGLQDDISSSCI